VPGRGARLGRAPAGNAVADRDVDRSRLRQHARATQPHGHPGALLVAARARPAQHAQAAAGVGTHNRAAAVEVDVLAEQGREAGADLRGYAQARGLQLVHGGVDVEQIPVHHGVQGQAERADLVLHIEQSLSASIHGSVVSRRPLSHFLFWLQESTAHVFVVATSRDPRGLPAELLRRGRFDAVFFIDLPDDSARDEKIRVHYARYLHSSAPDQLVRELVGLSEGFTGEDIEAALHEVGLAAESSGAEAPSHEFIKTVFTDTNPLGRTDPEWIESIRSWWGRRYAVPADVARRSVTLVDRREEHPEQ